MTRESYISVETEIDGELHKSLAKYLDCHPYWDLNRVFNASLSLFMMQNWSHEEGIEKQDYDTCSRVYLDNIFHEYSTHLRYKQKS